MPCLIKVEKTIEEEFDEFMAANNFDTILAKADSNSNIKFTT